MPVHGVGESFQDGALYFPELCSRKIHLGMFLEVQRQFHKYRTMLSNNTTHPRKSPSKIRNYLIRKMGRVYITWSPPPHILKDFYIFLPVYRREMNVFV